MITDDDGVGRKVEKRVESPLAHLDGILGVLAICEIARDFRKSQQVTSLIANRGDYHVDPETRTIFSDPPSFVFRPS
ncbi:MAG: hypothetical protein WCC18_02005 [Candidatus Acidiferrales bacterium]